MSRKGKRNFNLGKNKLVNLLRNSLRIIFLIIFFHWILWFTTYAKCTNYREAINDEKIDQHDKKTEKYNSKGLLSDKFEEKNVGEVENDILEQIEKKSEKLKEGDLPRKWEKEKLPELKKIHEKVEELEKKENKSFAEETELKKKKEGHDKKFKEDKEDTIKNIQEQLEKNDLNITELDDNRSRWQQMTHDPLKFCLVSPLNKSSKVLGIHKHPFLEIIFKLVIIEVILLFTFYFETIKLWENMEKIRNPYLSVEEKEQLNEEASPLVKYIFFNGFMMVLFNFFLSFHPAFFDRTTSLFQAGRPGTQLFIWIGPLFISLLLSNVSNEFLRRGRLLNVQELKKYVAKSWAINLIFALAIILLAWKLRMNSVGSCLLSFLGGLVKFIINTIRVKFFGHRE